MFIFPKRESDFPELKEIFGIHYSTSANGWMTANLFAIWCITFIAHIQNLRENGDLQNDRDVFLFLDGHSSRFSSFGMRLLKRFRIRAIIYPSHCTHVLQAFDVGVASPLKSLYEKHFINMMTQFKSENKANPTAAQMRVIRVKAFMEAWCGITTEKIKKAFAAAGSYPFTKEGLAMSHLITPIEVAERIYTKVNENKNFLNGKEATSDEVIIKLPLHTTQGSFHNIVDKQFIIIEADQICGSDIAYEWNKGNSNNGKVFSKLPAIYEKGINIVYGK